MADDNGQLGLFGPDDHHEPQHPRREKRPLLDRERSRQVTADAIDRAALLSDADFIQIMDDAICDLARERQYLCADFVWQRIGYVGNLHLGGRDNGSGLGPRLKSWQKAGLLEYVGQHQSDRAPTHRDWKCLWKSLIYLPSPLTDAPSATEDTPKPSTPLPERTPTWTVWNNKA